MNYTHGILAQTLIQAIEELNLHNLYISSKYCQEHLLGMAIEHDSSDRGDSQTLIPLFSNHLLVPKHEKDLIHYINILFKSHEYQRCAYILRNKYENNLLTSPLSIFLLTYSLYLAGEKIREQNIAENSGNNSNNTNKDHSHSTQHGPMNPFLNEIFHILYPIYVRSQSNSNSIPHDSMTQSDDEHETFDHSAGSGHCTSSSRNSQIKGCHEMNGYLYYIFGIVVRDIRLYNRSSIGDIIHEIKEVDHEMISVVPHAYELLFTAVELNPYNWSCWLEISNGYTSIDDSSPSISSPPLPPFPQWITQVSHHLTNKQFQPPPPSSSTAASSSASPSFDYSTLTLKDCMIGFFTVQILLDQQKGNIALSILTILEKIFPNSQILRSQIALAHYGMRDYPSAQEIFERNHLMDPYRLEHLDVYSNILYVKEKRAELSHLAHTCVKVDKFRPETCCIVGNYYSLKGQHEKAVISFQRALKVDRKYLAAWTLMGHEYVELRNTTAAVQCYRQAVEVNRCDYRAWYGLGQTYEMLYLHLYSLYYYKRAAALRPIDARMWCAVGNCLSRLTAGGVPNGSVNALQAREMGLKTKREAIEAYKRAVACDDGEGLATRELARLYRELGDNDKAAEYYGRYVQDRLALHAEGLQSSSSDPEELDRLIASELSINLPIDSDMAEGLLFRANTAFKRADYVTAEAYCLKLLDYRGPEGAEARSILKEIRRTTIAT